MTGARPVFGRCRLVEHGVLPALRSSLIEVEAHPANWVVPRERSGWFRLWRAIWDDINPNVPRQSQALRGDIAPGAGKDRGPFGRLHELGSPPVTGLRERAGHRFPSHREQIACLTRPTASTSDCQPPSISRGQPDSMKAMLTARLVTAIHPGMTVRADRHALETELAGKPV